MEKDYVSAVLSNGQVIISQVDIVLDEEGYYTFINPLKPVIMPETNKVALVQMNAFSDAEEYKIHQSFVMSIGSLDATYIDTYTNAVDSIEHKRKVKYQRLVEDTDEDFDEEYDALFDTLHESKDSIH
jgi:hypothetical protein